MSSEPAWPGGAGAAISITVDNLGEAAEIELGLRGPSESLGGHYSVTTALPIMLDMLAAADLPATFFVEGINAEIYPRALLAIAAARHELAYHSWCHEDWSALDAGAEQANLDRGLAALSAIGVDVVGLRPPGGRITPRTLELIADRGLTYCSPAGTVAGIERVAIVPFTWPAVDCFHVLPGFAALRERVTGSAEAGGPDAVRDALLGLIEEVVVSGGHATLVLHNWMIELEKAAVGDVLARVRAGVDAGELWAARCRDVAGWIAAHPLLFAAAPVLDSTSWMAPA